MTTHSAIKAVGIVSGQWSKPLGVWLFITKIKISRNGLSTPYSAVKWHTRSNFKKMLFLHVSYVAGRDKTFIHFYLAMTSYDQSTTVHTYII